MSFTHTHTYASVRRWLQLRFDFYLISIRRRSTPIRRQTTVESKFVATSLPSSWYRRRRRFRIDTEVRCVGTHPPFGPLSRRGLNPIKPVWPDGRLKLTASAFNQLLNTSSPGCRGYCYAELAVFFPSGGRNHRPYSLHLPTEGWPG